ncbi:hypothetical protein L1049_027667 [Liquidambar formosana]|uniref:Uncharacterized protein n=1 Tax=Liquidambar formosana TaxID=63359 RepID=A0AAP0WSQ1_LIQFO
MEAGKRKRAEQGEVEVGRKMVREGEEEEGEAPPPTEEEVEEFFAILRRMHDAVKYFEKGNADGRRLKGRWRTALEADAVEEVVVEGVKVSSHNEAAVVVKRGGERVGESRVLDLNAAPEGDSNSA